jgi:hypothetical protein
MRSIYLLSLFTLLSSSSFATHLIGGEITYEYINTVPNGDLQYLVTVQLYRDCQGIELRNPLVLGVYLNDNPKSLNQVIEMPLTSREIVDLSCGLPDDFILSGQCVELGRYEKIISVKPYSEGYTLNYQSCCRNTSTNLTQSGNIPDQGFDLRATIPNTALKNSTAPSEYIRLACVGETNYWDPYEIDPDGDSVVYTPLSPYTGGSMANPDPTPAANLSSPQLVNYKPGYNVTYPFGTSGTYNIAHNILEFTAINTGQYDIAFLVEEYRNGVLISAHNVEAAIIVIDCPPIYVFNAPYDLQASRFSHWETKLNWRNCNNQVDKYEVFRKEDKDTTFTSLGYTDGPLRSYIDSSITQQGTYTYYVEGVSDSFTSGQSNQDSIDWWNLSTAPQQIGELNFFPNPVSNKLTLNSIHKIQSVIVLDPFGKEIIKQNVPNLTGAELDLKELSRGMYFVQVLTDNGFITKRVLKE